VKSLRGQPSLGTNENGGAIKGRDEDSKTDDDDDVVLLITELNARLR